jgi:nitrate/nitrite transporter NarK
VKKRGLKFSRRLIGSVSLGMMGLLFVITATTSDNAIATACLMLGYFFQPLYGINALAACIDIGRSKACTVTGIMNFAGQVGAFFLAILFGKIADITLSYNAPLFIVAGVLLIGSFMWLAVDPTKQIDAEATGIELKFAS